MLKKVNNFLHQKTLISVFMSFIYAALTFVWVQHHELWADEVNVYLILKNLSFGQALMHISAEGHPFLFYMLCLPFVKMGFSMFSVQMICHAACSAAVFILFRFSPFPFVLNLLFSLSAGMFYFFPVICRSYSILPLLLLLLAALYPKIKENGFISDVSNYTFSEIKKWLIENAIVSDDNVDDVVWALFPAESIENILDENEEDIRFSYDAEIEATWGLGQYLLLADPAGAWSGDNLVATQYNLGMQDMDLSALSGKTAKAVAVQNSSADVKFIEVTSIKFEK